MGLVCKKLLLYNLYMKKEGKYFTIGEVAKRFRLSNRTLRYYEEKGILRPTYGNNGYRYYTNSELVTLDMIRCLRRLDIPIEKDCKPSEGKRWKSKGKCSGITHSPERGN